MRVLKVVLAAVAIAIGGAACSSGDDQSGRPASRDAAVTVSDSAAQRGSVTKSERRGITIRNFGIELTVPAGWDGRMFLKWPGDLPEVHAGSFPLPPSDAQLEFDKAASRIMRTNDIRIRLIELPSIQVGTQGFNPTKLPIAIRRSNMKPSPWIPRDHAYASRRFAVRGRPFSFGVEFGQKRPTARQWEQVKRVVSSLEIDSRPELDPRQWRPLRRPLKLPTVAPEAACPRSSSTPTTARVTWPLGPGPVYPGVGSPNGVASLKDDLVQKGWYLHKTLWAISPSYRGPVLIRGARVDNSGALRFNFRLTREFRLHKLPPNEARRWRYVPSHTALRGPGCYALQVDGSSFSRVIVFEATTDA